MPQERPDTTLASMAYQRILEGHDVKDVAEYFEISENQVILAINNRIKTENNLMSTESRTAIVDMEVARYNALLRAHWPSAMMADPKSTELVLKIMKDRQALQQLHAIDPMASQQVMLVISANEENYVEQLKNVADTQ